MFYFNPDLAAADLCEEGDEAFESYNLEEEEDDQNSVEVLNFPFNHSFHWHVQNATILCRSQELLPFLSVMYFFMPTLLHQLFFHPLSPHLAIYFLVCLSFLLFPNSYILAFWEFCFLPFSVHAQTSVIYLTLLSCINFFIG